MCRAMTSDLERKRTAGTGLSRRGPRERPAVRSVPALRGPLHDDRFPLRGCRRGRCSLPAAPTADVPPGRRRRRAISFCLISSAASASTRRCCAPRWKRAFGGSDAAGAWDWKTAYDACEAATVLFLRKFGPAMRAQAASPAGDAADAGQDRRLFCPPIRAAREESQALQQFSTPIALAFVAAHGRRDHAGRRRARALGRDGLLAIFAELAGASLVLNELAETRAGLLALLFPGVAVTRLDAAHIHDHLDAGIGRASC